MIDLHPVLLRAVVLFGSLFFASIPSLQAQQAATPMTDEALLASRDELLPFLSPSQRLQFIQAEGQIEAGESDLRTAQYLSDRKPSNLNPNEDLSQVRARGKQLAIEARKMIVQGKQDLVKLLRVAEATKLASAKPDEEIFEGNIARQSTFEAAFAQAAGQTLRAAWDSGFNLLFFNGVHLTSGETTGSAAPDIRNQAYDALIGIDGTRFSVTVPFDLAPNREVSGSTRPFSFENMEVLDNGRVALLGIELISFDWPEAENTPEAETAAGATASPTEEAAAEAAVSEDPAAPAPQLLMVSAIHLRTLELIHQEMVWIGDEASLQDPRLAQKFHLIEKQQSAQKLTTLTTPYAYTVEAALEDPLHAIAVSAYLQRTLQSHFKLTLVPLGFLQRAFGEEAAVGFKRFANARFIALPSTTETTAFTVSAKADATDQTLPIGTLELLSE